MPIYVMRLVSNSITIDASSESVALAHGKEWLLDEVVSGGFEIEIRNKEDWVDGFEIGEGT